MSCPTVDTTLTDDFAAIIVCPNCKGDLHRRGEELQCEQCVHSYRCCGATPMLFDESAFAGDIAQYELAPDVQPRTGTLSWLRRIIRRRPWLLGPSIAHDRGKSARFAALRQRWKFDGALVVSVGSRGRGLWPQVLCTDVTPGENVGLCCDAHSLPFADSSIDCFFATSLFEHLRAPQQAAKELFRCTKAGAQVYIEVPWMYEVHGDPLDFQRWTLAGLKELFSDFAIIEQGVTEGPVTTWARMTRQCIASIFRNHFLFYGVRVLLTWLLFWCKYAEWLIPRERKNSMAMGYYVLLEKPR